MTFKLIATPEFLHDVKIVTPGVDAPIAQTLKTRFRAMAEDEIEAIDLGDREALKGFLRKTVTWFDDIEVEDADGTPQTKSFGPQTLELMLAVPHVRVGFLTGYFKGLTEFRVGNSNGQAAVGPKAA